MVKNTAKTILLIIIAYLCLPTGDPTDFIITSAIINAFGLTAYTLLSVFLIIILYQTIEGKTIKDKLKNVKKEMRNLLR